MKNTFSILTEIGAGNLVKKLTSEAPKILSVKPYQYC